MIQIDQLIKIGKTLKPHGIKGEFSVLIDSFSDDLQLSCLIFNIDGIYVPFFIESIRPKGIDVYIVKVKGYDNDNDITELIGLDVYAFKKELTHIIDEHDEDCMYAEDFVGYSILDKSGILVGTIVDYDVSTENSLFIVERTDNRELYIPIVDDFVININNETKTLQMDLPIGLLEL